MSQIPSDVVSNLTTFSKALKSIEEAVAEFIKLTPEQRESVRFNVFLQRIIIE